jgi:hypothetical protein
MKRLVVVSVAMGLLFGGSIILIFLVTRPASSSGSPTVATAALVPPSTATLPSPAVSSVPGAPFRKSAVPGDRFKATPMAGRVTRKLVRKALLAGPVQTRLARCVDQVGGFGDGPGAGRGPRVAPAVLTIELEGLDRELKIVDAEVMVWGGASAASVSCARDALRGQVIRAPQVDRGHHVRMLFPLTPRSHTVTATRAAPTASSPSAGVARSKGTSPSARAPDVMPGEDGQTEPGAVEPAGAQVGPGDAADEG